MISFSLESANSIRALIESIELKSYVSGCMIFFTIVGQLYYIKIIIFRYFVCIFIGIVSGTHSLEITILGKIK